MATVDKDFKVKNEIFEQYSSMIWSASGSSSIAMHVIIELTINV